MHHLVHLDDNFWDSRILWLDYIGMFEIFWEIPDIGLRCAFETVLNFAWKHEGKQKPNNERGELGTSSKVLVLNCDI